MPDPPPLAACYLPLTPLTVPPLAFVESAPPVSGPWANDLFPAVLLLTLGAGLVALGAWIVKPPPPRRDDRRSRGDRKRNRGPRRDSRGRFRGPPPNGTATPASPPPDPIRRPLRLP